MPKKNKLKKFKKKIKRKKDLKNVSDQAAKPNFYKSKIYKTNEVKIKKITKQATEKRIYSIKDYVVYPKHGVGKIVAVETAKIGNR